MARRDAVTGQLAQQRARGIRTAIVIAVVVVVLRYLPLTAGISLFSVPENFAYDVAFDRRAPQPPTDIVIIAIDDESLRPDRLGQFPWPRGVYADLLAQIPNAKVVAFDILFAEPDRSGPEADARFAQAMRTHGRVVLGAYKRVHAEYAEDNPPKIPGYPMPEDGPGPLARIQPLNFTPPIAPLADAAAGVGYVDIEPDKDGVYRRVKPLCADYAGENTYPHFATEIARLVTGTTPEQVVSQIPRGRVTLAGRAAFVNANGTMLINYCGPTGTIARHSFWDVMHGDVPATEFADKIVLVGATAPGLYDIRPAPYRRSNRFFLGVETNANIVNSLLHMPPLRDSSRATLWLAFALVLGAIAGWMVWTNGEVVGPLLGALILVLIALPSFFAAFTGVNQIIPYGAVVLAVAIPVALGVYERLGAERRMIREQFSAYVSPDVLRMLARNPEILRAGQRREVTILFSDVRGSTSLSENAQPEIWLAQLNEYMSEMTAAIFQFDGYLDKFMGDGIMAVWNAFGTQENHAELALQASQAMLERLQALNAYWEQTEDRTPFRIGIGLHTGEAVLGDAGSDQRRQYTAIGDVVNTAARIETMNKELGTVCIISESTAAHTQDLVKLREIGEMPVPGRSQPVRIFEVPSADVAPGNEIG